MRRLLAIAMTRARERLVLAYPARREGRAPPALALPRGGARGRGLELEDREEELFGPAEALHATFRMMRDELLDTSRAPAGACPSCAWTPTSTSSHAVVRYLELLKLAALLARPTARTSPTRCRRSTRAWPAR